MPPDRREVPHAVHVPKVDIIPTAPHTPEIRRSVAADTRFRLSQPSVLSRVADVCLDQSADTQLKDSRNLDVPPRRDSLEAPSIKTQTDAMAKPVNAHMIILKRGALRPKGTSFTWVQRWRVAVWLMPS
jgi:hypothetical protein